jgi:hypothetical protein
VIWAKVFALFQNSVALGAGVEELGHGSLLAGLLRWRCATVIPKAFGLSMCVFSPLESNTRHIPPAATAGKDGQQSKDNEVSDA